MSRIHFVWMAPVVVLVAMAVGGQTASAQMGTTGAFAGAKVNGGTASFSQQGTTRTLMLSADFQVPDTPDPHWQVVDSRGEVYLLQKLSIKGDRINRSIAVPAYVRDIAKVQIYCSWAEAVLGEASFGAAVGQMR